MFIYFGPFLLSFLILGLFSSCAGENKPQEPSVLKKKQPASIVDNTRFFSKNNPGKWKKLSNTHSPKFEIKIEDDKKIIHAYTTLKGKINPVHYIETIILADHTLKELDKKRFIKGKQSSVAKFTLAKEYKSYVFLISKCNQHDMWITRVDW